MKFHAYGKLGGPFGALAQCHCGLCQGPVRDNFKMHPQEKLRHLRIAINRVADVDALRVWRWRMDTRDEPVRATEKRFAALWTARNRRTRVLMARKGAL